jgi:hypothetical protein
MPARRECSTGDGGRRSKAPEERTRGTAVRGWPAMEIRRGSGFGEGWFSQERRELKAAGDRGLGVAAVLDGRIGDRSVMPCRRVQAPG